VAAGELSHVDRIVPGFWGGFRGTVPRHRAAAPRVACSRSALGEGEKVYVGKVPPEHIRGAWAVVDGHHRWFPNPNFDHTILKGRP